MAVQPHPPLSHKMSLLKTHGITIRVVAIGAGAVVIGGLVGAWWWWWRSKRDNGERSRPPNAEEFTVPVATVDNLWIYPFKSGPQGRNGGDRVYEERTEA